MHTFDPTLLFENLIKTNFQNYKITKEALTKFISIHPLINNGFPGELIFDGHAIVIKSHLTFRPRKMSTHGKLEHMANYELNQGCIHNLQSTHLGSNPLKISKKSWVEKYKVLQILGVMGLYLSQYPMLHLVTITITFT